jgi:hypothetical protein
VIAFRCASDQRRLSPLMETAMRSSALATVMRTTILGLFGSTLIVASIANAATAGKHLTRHHKTYASKTIGNADAFRAETPNAFAGDQSAFGTTSRWPPSGMQPDDWRQSVNGD